MVLEYVRPVIRHKASSELVSIPEPSATSIACISVFHGGHVSVLADLLVDKFGYNLSLYREHRRLRDAGINLSRATLTYWVQRAIGFA